MVDLSSYRIKVAICLALRQLMIQMESSTHRYWGAPGQSLQEQLLLQMALCKFYQVHLDIFSQVSVTWLIPKII
ncbi:hypothetical protein CS390_12985 [Pseudomonas sp. HLS-6]|nr:hypothetical protein CS390_12985 [Pseudomonas sp. HLS-6]